VTNPKNDVVDSCPPTFIEPDRNWPEIIRLYLEKREKMTDAERDVILESIRVASLSCPILRSPLP